MLENDEKVILYVQTPSMLSKKTSDITAKVRGAGITVE